MSDIVLVEERQDVAILRMTHGKVNALDVELLIAVREAFESVHQSRAVVLTGNQS